MKYFANFNVNNGTRFERPIMDTNKKRIIKDIKEIAKGEIFCTSTNSGSFFVEDETGRDVITGHILISKKLKPYCRINKMGDL